MTDRYDFSTRSLIDTGARSALNAVERNVGPAFSFAAAWWSRLWLFATLFIPLLLSFGYQEYFQNAGPKGFLRPLWSAIVVATFAYLVLAAVIEYFKHSTVAPLAVAFLLFLGGIRLIGAYSFYHDSICWLIGIVAVAIIVVWRKSGPIKERFSPKKQTAADVRAYVATFLLAIWISLWIADWAFQGQAIAREPGQIETRYRYAPEASSAFDHLEAAPRARVGLALSGGGYRAALMHAGVLSLLDSIGVRPQAISSVSGGSIIGSFYQADGRPSSFLQAMQDGRFHLRRELFHPSDLFLILATLPIPRTPYKVLPLDVHNRTHVQAGMLDKLFLNNTVIGGKEKRLGRAELMLCATELQGGSLIGFVPNGAVIKPIDPPVWRFHALSLKKEPPAVSFLSWSPKASQTTHTALLVAASGAFPGAFKPVRVSISGKLPANSPVKNPMVLSDGGIGDNLGLVLLYSAADLANSTERPPELAKEWDINVVMASDGSALSAPQSPSNTIRVLSSAIDAVARTSGAASLVNLDPPPVILSPTPLVRNVEAALSNADAPDQLVSLPFDDNGRQLARERRTHNGKASEIVPTLSYWNLDIEDLRFFAAHMTVAGTDKAALEKELAAAETRIARDTIAGPETDLGLSLEQSLHRRIERELARRIKVFINTSTLDDRVPRENAEALYILGQYLVVLNKPFIQYALQHPRPAKTGGVARTHREK